jgi:hypothetical protein
MRSPGHLSGRQIRSSLAVVALALVAALLPAANASATSDLPVYASLDAYGNAYWPTAPIGGYERLGLPAANGSGCATVSLALVRYTSTNIGNEATWAIHVWSTSSSWTADQTFGGDDRPMGVQGWVQITADGNLEEWSYIRSYMPLAILTTAHWVQTPAIRVWQSNSHAAYGGTAHLVLTSGGNLEVVQDADSKVIWQTGTRC